MRTLEVRVFGVEPPLRAISRIPGSGADFPIENTMISSFTGFQLSFPLWGVHKFLAFPPKRLLENRDFCNFLLFGRVRWSNRLQYF